VTNIPFGSVQNPIAKKIRKDLISHLKTSEFSSRFLPMNLGIPHNGAGWTSLAKGNHRFHFFLFSFEDGFNPAVTEVPHPPCYVMSMSPSPGFIPKEDSLDKPGDEDVSSNLQGANPKKTLLELIVRTN
jgi:hypothetical protein